MERPPCSSTYAAEDTTAAFGAMDGPQHRMLYADEAHQQNQPPNGARVVDPRDPSRLLFQEGQQHSRVGAVEASTMYASNNGSCSYDYYEKMNLNTNRAVVERDEPLLHHASLPLAEHHDQEHDIKYHHDHPAPALRSSSHHDAHDKNLQQERIRTLRVTLTDASGFSHCSSGNIVLIENEYPLEAFRKIHKHALMMLVQISINSDHTMGCSTSASGGTTALMMNNMMMPNSGGGVVPGSSYNNPQYGMNSGTYNNPIANSMQYQLWIFNEAFGVRHLLNPQHLLESSLWHGKIEIQLYVNGQKPPQLLVSSSCSTSSSSWSSGNSIMLKNTTARTTTAAAHNGHLQGYNHLHDTSTSSTLELDQQDCLSATTSHPGRSTVLGGGDDHRLTNDCEVEQEHSSSTSTEQVVEKIPRRGKNSSGSGSSSFSSASGCTTSSFVGPRREEDQDEDEKSSAISSIGVVGAAPDPPREGGGTSSADGGEQGEEHCGQVLLQSETNPAGTSGTTSAIGNKTSPRFSFSRQPTFSSTTSDEEEENEHENEEGMNAHSSSSANNSSSEETTASGEIIPRRGRQHGRNSNLTEQDIPCSSATSSFYTKTMEKDHFYTGEDNHSATADSNFATLAPSSDFYLHSRADPMSHVGENASSSCGQSEQVGLVHNAGDTTRTMSMALSYQQQHNPRLNLMHKQHNVHLDLQYDTSTHTQQGPQGACSSQLQQHQLQQHDAGLLNNPACATSVVTSTSRSGAPTTTCSCSHSQQELVVSKQNKKSSLKHDPNTLRNKRPLPASASDPNELHAQCEPFFIKKSILKLQRWLKKLYQNPRNEYQLMESMEKLFHSHCDRCNTFGLNWDLILLHPDPDMLLQEILQKTQLLPPLSNTNQHNNSSSNATSRSSGGTNARIQQVAHINNNAGGGGRRTTSRTAGSGMKKTSGGRRAISRTAEGHQDTTTTGGKNNNIMKHNIKSGKNRRGHQLQGTNDRRDESVGEVVVATSKKKQKRSSSASKELLHQDRPQETEEARMLNLRRKASKDSNMASHLLPGAAFCGHKDSSPPAVNADEQGENYKEGEIIINHRDSSCHKHSRSDSKNSRSSGKEQHANNNSKRNSKNRSGNLKIDLKTKIIRTDSNSTTHNNATATLAEMTSSCLQNSISRTISATKAATAFQAIEDTTYTGGASNIGRAAAPFSSTQEQRDEAGLEVVQRDRTTELIVQPLTEEKIENLMKSGPSTVAVLSQMNHLNINPNTDHVHTAGGCGNKLSSLNAIAIGTTNNLNQNLQEATTPMMVGHGSILDEEEQREDEEYLRTRRSKKNEELLLKSRKNIDECTEISSPREILDEEDADEEDEDHGGLQQLHGDDCDFENENSLYRGGEHVGGRGAPAPGGGHQIHLGTTDDEDDDLIVDAGDTFGCVTEIDLGTMNHSLNNHSDSNSSTQEDDFTPTTNQSSRGRANKNSFGCLTLREHHGRRIKCEQGRQHNLLSRSTSENNQSKGTTNMSSSFGMSTTMTAQQRRSGSKRSSGMRMGGGTTFNNNGSSSRGHQMRENGQARTNHHNDPKFKAGRSNSKHRSSGAAPRGGHSSGEQLNRAYQHPTGARTSATSNSRNHHHNTAAQRQHNQSTLFQNELNHKINEMEEELYVLKKCNLIYILATPLDKNKFGQNNANSNNSTSNGGRYNAHNQHGVVENNYNAAAGGSNATSGSTVKIETVNNAFQLLRKRIRNIVLTIGDAFKKRLEQALYINERTGQLTCFGSSSNTNCGNGTQGSGLVHQHNSSSAAAAHSSLHSSNSNHNAVNSTIYGFSNARNSSSTQHLLAGGGGGGVMGGTNGNNGAHTSLLNNNGMLDRNAQQNQNANHNNQQNSQQLSFQTLVQIYLLISQVVEAYTNLFSGIGGSGSAVELRALSHAEENLGSWNMVERIYSGILSDVLEYVEGCLNRFEYLFKSSVLCKKVTELFPYTKFPLDVAMTDYHFYQKGWKSTGFLARCNLKADLRLRMNYVGPHQLSATSSAFGLAGGSRLSLRDVKDKDNLRSCATTTACRGAPQHSGSAIVSSSHHDINSSSSSMAYHRQKKLLLHSKALLYLKNNRNHVKEPPVTASNAGGANCNLTHNFYNHNFSRNNYGKRNYNCSSGAGGMLALPDYGQNNQQLHYNGTHHDNYYNKHYQIDVETGQNNSNLVDHEVFRMNKSFSKYYSVRAGFTGSLIKQDYSMHLVQQHDDPQMSKLSFEDVGSLQPLHSNYNYREDPDRAGSAEHSVGGVVENNYRGPLHHGSSTSNTFNIDEMQQQKHYPGTTATRGGTNNFSGRYNHHQRQSGGNINSSSCNNSAHMNENNLVILRLCPSRNFHYSLILAEKPTTLWRNVYRKAMRYYGLDYMELSAFRSATHLLPEEPIGNLLSSKLFHSIIVTRPTEMSTADRISLDLIRILEEDYSLDRATMQLTLDIPQEYLCLPHIEASRFIADLLVLPYEITTSSSSSSSTSSPNAASGSSSSNLASSSVDNPKHSTTSSCSISSSKNVNKTSNSTSGAVEVDQQNQHLETSGGPRHSHSSSAGRAAQNQNAGTTITTNNTTSLTKTTNSCNTDEPGDTVNTGNGATIIEQQMHSQQMASTQNHGYYGSSSASSVNRLSTSDNNLDMLHVSDSAAAAQQQAQHRAQQQAERERQGEHLQGRNMEQMKTATSSIGSNVAIINGAHSMFSKEEVETTGCTGPPPAPSGAGGHNSSSGVEHQQQNNSTSRMKDGTTTTGGAGVLASGSSSIFGRWSATSTAVADQHNVADQAAATSSTAAAHQHAGSSDLAPANNGVSTTSITGMQHNSTPGPLCGAPGGAGTPPRSGTSSSSTSHNSSSASLNPIKTISGTSTKKHQYRFYFRNSHFRRCVSVECDYSEFTAWLQFLQHLRRGNRVRQVDLMALNARISFLDVTALCSHIRHLSTKVELFRSLTFGNYVPPGLANYAYHSEYFFGKSVVEISSAGTCSSSSGSSIFPGQEDGNSIFLTGNQINIPTTGSTGTIGLLVGGGSAGGAAPLALTWDDDYYKTTGPGRCGTTTTTTTATTSVRTDMDMVNESAKNFAGSSTRSETASGGPSRGEAAGSGAPVGGPENEVTNSTCGRAGTSSNLAMVLSQLQPQAEGIVEKNLRRLEDYWLGIRPGKSFQFFGKSTAPTAGSSGRSASSTIVPADAQGGREQRAAARGSSRSASCGTSTVGARSTSSRRDHEDKKTSRASDEEEHEALELQQGTATNSSKNVHNLMMKNGRTSCRTTSGAAVGPAGAEGQGVVVAASSSSPAGVLYNSKLPSSSAHVVGTTTCTRQQAGNNNNPSQWSQPHTKINPKAGRIHHSLKHANNHLSSGSGSSHQHHLMRMHKAKLMQLPVVEEGVELQDEDEEDDVEDDPPHSKRTSPVDVLSPPCSSAEDEGDEILLKATLGTTTTTATRPDDHLEEAEGEESTRKADTDIVESTTTNRDVRPLPRQEKEAPPGLQIAQLRDEEDAAFETPRKVRAVAKIEANLLVERQASTTAPSVEQVLDGDADATTGCTDASTLYSPPDHLPEDNWCVVDDENHLQEHEDKQGGAPSGARTAASQYLNVSVGSCSTRVGEVSQDLSTSSIQDEDHSLLMLTGDVEQEPQQTLTPDLLISSRCVSEEQASTGSSLLVGSTFLLESPPVSEETNVDVEHQGRAPSARGPPRDAQHNFCATSNSDGAKTLSLSPTRGCTQDDRRNNDSTRPSDVTPLLLHSPDFLATERPPRRSDTKLKPPGGAAPAAAQKSMDYVGTKIVVSDEEDHQLEVHGRDETSSKAGGGSFFFTDENSCATGVDVDQNSTTDVNSEVEDFSTSEQDNCTPRSCVSNTTSNADEQDDDFYGRGPGVSCAEEDENYYNAKPSLLDTFWHSVSAFMTSSTTTTSSGENINTTSEHGADKKLFGTKNGRRPNDILSSEARREVDHQQDGSAIRHAFTSTSSSAGGEYQHHDHHSDQSTRSPSSAASGGSESDFQSLTFGAFHDKPITVKVPKLHGRRAGKQSFTGPTKISNKHQHGPSSQSDVESTACTESDHELCHAEAGTAATLSVSPDEAGGVGTAQETPAIRLSDKLKTTSEVETTTCARAKKLSCTTTARTRINRAALSHHPNLEQNNLSNRWEAEMKQPIEQETRITHYRATPNVITPAYVLGATGSSTTNAIKNVADTWLIQRVISTASTAGGNLFIANNAGQVNAALVAAGSGGVTGGAGAASSQAVAHAVAASSTGATSVGATSAASAGGASSSLAGGINAIGENFLPLKHYTFKVDPMRGGLHVIRQHPAAGPSFANASSAVAGKDYMLAPTSLAMSMSVSIGVQSVLGLVRSLWLAKEDTKMSDIGKELAVDAGKGACVGASYWSVLQLINAAQGCASMPTMQFAANYLALNPTPALLGILGSGWIALRYLMYTQKHLTQEQFLADAVFSGYSNGMGAAACILGASLGWSPALCAILGCFVGSGVAAYTYECWREESTLILCKKLRKLAIVTLGLPQQFDEQLLNTRYRTLARYTHPDRNKSADAKQMFELIQLAREICRNELTDYEEAKQRLNQLWGYLQEIK
ncbi:unnamed protein product [Amoebophrya sp. A120]|nr:unnamed protein product [Amoebophrya sp. A120]|eukprot:GSA120T00016440001.1